jgi:hypothetical protein
MRIALAQPDAWPIPVRELDAGGFQGVLNGGEIIGRVRAERRGRRLSKMARNRLDHDHCG